MKLLLVSLACSLAALSTAFASFDSITINVEPEGWAVSEQKIRTQIELLKFIDAHAKDKETPILIHPSSSTGYTMVKDTLDALGYAEYLNVSFTKQKSG